MLPPADATNRTDVPTPACLLLALLVVCLAFVLRIWQVKESLWLDELHTAWVVGDGAEQVCPRAMIGNQSPVYFWAIWPVTRWAGLSEPALRLPSIAAGVALVVLTFYLALRWTGVCSAGLLAALLVTLDQHFIFYAQEARPYAWIQLAGVSHVFLFQQVVSQPTRLRRVGCVVLGGLLFYLHYTSVLLLLAEAVYYAILSLHRPWRPAYRPRDYGLDSLMLGVCFLPAVHHLLEIASRRNAWALFVRNDNGAQMTLDMARSLGLTIYVVLPLVVLLVAYGVQWLRRRTKRNARSAAFPDVRLLVLAGCWLLVPLIVTWVTTTFDVARLFFFRYVLVGAIVPMVFAAGCHAACPPGLWRGILACMLIVASVYQGDMIRQFRYDGRFVGDRHQDWRAAVKMLNARDVDRGGPVFVRSGLIEAERLRTSDDPRLREYCLLPVRSIYRLEREERELIPLPTVRTGRLSASHRKQLMDAGGGWFLLAGSPTGMAAIERDLLAGWASYGVAARITGRRWFGNLAVLRVAIGPYRTSPQSRA